MTDSDNNQEDRQRTQSPVGEPSKLLRVLIAAPSLDILGGQSRQAVRLIDGLSLERSLKVGFVPHNPRLPAGFGWLQRIKYVRTIAVTALYWLKLLVNVPRYDIIHVFSAAYYSYLLSAAPAILMAKLFGKKSILNYRSGEAKDHLQNWHLTGVPIIRLADSIVVCSGYLVEVFARFGLSARFVYDVVELDRFSYRERRPIRPVFLTSRLLEPLYNVPCVLRAFALVQQRYPEASLTIAAEGFLQVELEKLAGDLQLKETRFIGRVPFEEMPATYDRADIYLTATNLDNMPGSVTESMACGLPVVTTNAGGIPYIVTHEETCMMIECDDHEAMAAAAVRLLEDNELAVGIGRRAREAARKFTWEAVRDEWLDVYFKLFSQAATDRDPCSFEDAPAVNDEGQRLR